MSFLQRTPPSQVWLLSDGHAGNVRQGEALALALGLQAHAPALVPVVPWRWLAPRRLPGATHAFGPAFAHALAQQNPPLAIGCGRQGALATRLLRARGARVVQILDPRIDPRHWDLVIVPAHDGLRGDNVVPLLGSLNPVDDAWLADAATRFPPLLELPQPRILLLAGGPTRHSPWTTAQLHGRLAALREHVLAEGGSLLATVSRRTPADVVACLRAQLAGLPGLLWDGATATANPYPGMLAAADRIVCTPDSVNMLSEACATRAPVEVFAADCASGRIATFLRALRARDRIEAHAAAVRDTSVVPLRETARVAAEVRERLGLTPM